MKKWIISYHNLLDFFFGFFLDFFGFFFLNFFFIFFGFFFLIFFWFFFGFFYSRNMLSLQGKRIFFKIWPWEVEKNFSRQFFNLSVQHESHEPNDGIGNGDGAAHTELHALITREKRPQKQNGMKKKHQNVTGLHGVQQWEDNVPWNSRTCPLKLDWTYHVINHHRYRFSSGVDQKNQSERILRDILKRIGPRWDLKMKNLLIW